MRAENKAAAEVKGRGRMLRIVWLRTERNPLIVVTRECSREGLKGTQDEQRITKLKIAWEGGGRPEALPLLGETALLRWRKSLDHLPPVPFPLKAQHAGRAAPEDSMAINTSKVSFFF